ncbi:MAG TPA: hypothetical protein VGN12_20170 [Pirellulales bacterium]|jgi:hypothetical protein
MPTTIHRPVKPRSFRRVAPSIAKPPITEKFTLEQELKPFGAWVGNTIWVPPKDAKEALAETMLRETRPFTAQEQRWKSVIKKHRDDFTQVRELNLFEASIRLPKGRFFVTVTEEEHFDKIIDTIPRSVQTRLDEFLSGPAKKQGAKVYYLKPLCVEVGDDLILTSGEDLTAAIAKVQAEVFAEYRRLARYRRPLQAMQAAVNLGLAMPRGVMKYAIDRKQKALDAYQAHLEFTRRKLALRTAKTFRKCRTEGCSFDEMLDLTSQLQRVDVVDQYCIDHELTSAKRKQLVRIATGSLPWFVALSLTISYMSSVAVAVSTPPLIVVDPAFVAEMPGSNGVILKIGHFDEVGGITHVEI